MEEAFQAAGLTVFEADVRTADRFLAAKRIRGGVRIRGAPVPGRFVDVVFRDPDLEAADASAPLRTLSLDIENDVEAGTVLAVSLAGPDVREVLYLDETGALFSRTFSGPDLAGSAPDAEGERTFEEPDDEGKPYLVRSFSRGRTCCAPSRTGYGRRTPIS